MECYHGEHEYTIHHCLWEIAEGRIYPMTIYDKPPRYRTYLLTVWEERSQDPATPAVWRYRLEDPRSGQRRGFASLEVLADFLRAELAGDEDELSV